MSWSAAQQAMLKAMGLRVWAPVAGPERAEGGAVETVDAVPAAAAPASASASASAPAEVGPGAGLLQDAPGPAPRPPAKPPLPQRPNAERPQHAAPPPTALRPQPAPSPAIGQLDWPALHAAVRDCRACALCDGRQQSILGLGPERADWLIVADPPDAQEDREGALFVGPAGRLLDNMLAALGLGRQGGVDAGDTSVKAVNSGNSASGAYASNAAVAARQVYITSALKCRAPRNRNPSAEELAQCAGHLQQQIALLQPKVILAMGRFANWQLLGRDEPIGPLRGQLHQAHGVPVIVTFHPLYLLRHQADKPRAWDDLCRAAAVVRAA